MLFSIEICKHIVYIFYCKQRLKISMLNTYFGSEYYEYDV